MLLGVTLFSIALLTHILRMTYEFGIFNKIQKMAFRCIIEMELFENEGAIWLERASMQFWENWLPSNGSPVTALNCWKVILCELHERKWLTAVGRNLAVPNAVP
jgi:hypothetical protein